MSMRPLGEYIVEPTDDDPGDVFLSLVRGESVRVQGPVSLETLFRTAIRMAITHTEES